MNPTRSARRRLTAAAAIACLAIGVPTVALAASSGPHARASTPRCNESDTYVWFALSPNGTAGPVYYPVEFTNIGRKACTLTGYPGVSAISAALHQLGAGASRIKSAVHTVTVRPGQTVHASLGVIDPGFLTGCHKAAADGLKVYPPNEKASQDVLSFSFEACRNKSVLTVYPVTSGIGVP
jgi:Protein of unknown function (DUF4232)